MHPLPEVTDLDMAFGRTDFVPKMNELPAEFQNYDNNKFCDIAAKLFFNGGKLADFGLSPREGVSVGKATRALGAFMGSFEPKHEHKMAAAGYLIDQWFEPFVMEHENPHRKQTVN